MMYRCVNCGNLFEEGEQAVWYENQGECHGVTAMERFSGCPVCNGDYEEVYQCEECGDWHTDDELYDGWCEKCLRESINKGGEEMSVEMGMRIIKVIEDVDFCFLGDWDMTDENLIMKFDPKHGTVIYVAGIIEGDPNSLMSLGAEEGSTDFKVAFYAPFKEFNKMWDELMKL